MPVLSCNDSGYPILSDGCHQGKPILQSCMDSSVPGAENIAHLKLMTQIAALQSMETSGNEVLEDGVYESSVKESVEGEIVAQEYFFRDVEYSGNRYRCAYIYQR